MPWVIDVIAHRDDPAGVPHLTYGRLVGLADDLPPGLRVGDRFGPVAAADGDGELWHVPVAVVTGVGGPLATAATVGPFRRVAEPSTPAPAVTSVLILAEPERRPRLLSRKPWAPSAN